MVKRREFLRAAFGFAAGNVILRDLLTGSQPGRKPNIIFTLTETLGIGGLSCYGADNFRTPNIDRLAEGGTRFTHAYTAPLTGPSRAMMLTGRYAFRTGVTSQDAIDRIEPSGETMLPRILKTAGYATVAAGKWNFPSGPDAFGFDEHLKTNTSGAKPVPDREYMPDVMHQFLVDFIARHRDTPFYAFYSMSQMRGEVLPTPDSAPDSKDYYTDNIRYMDKLVGKLVGELERLKLRENTLILFTSDSGTGTVYAGESTIRGRRLAGEKGSMLEGGSLVPLIANWPGQTPAGKVNSDLIDSSDFLPTLADVAAARPPEKVVIDGRSFGPQLHGDKGQPRDWVYIQLGSRWYLREAGWKLNHAGELFDMSQAPFEELEVPADTNAPSAIAARARLQAVLDKLNPAGGIADEGDGTGRPVSRLTIKKKKSRKNPQR